MSSTSPHVMVPKPDELDLDFYQAVVKAGALCLQRCDDCGTHTHPARYYCPSCSSGAFRFATVGGRGTVYSYTVSHMSVEPAWQAHVPYVTLVVELPEGPRIVATARGLKPEDVRIGQPVQVIAEAKSADFAIFWAEPVAS